MINLDALLAPVDQFLDQHYPTPFRLGQPPHTVYVSGADASEAITQAWAAQALGLVETHHDLLQKLDAHGVLPRVIDRLSERPIQDLRFDFEDGYGWRDDAIENRHALRAGEVLQRLSRQEDGPQSCGIRPKGLAPHERHRLVQTLEAVLAGAGGVPAGFAFTVPKLRHADQVPAVVALCREFERVHGLSDGALKFELQIESPQAVIAADGAVPLAAALHASEGRCTGLHFGTYDYSAACGIAPQHQSLDHPVADHAKAVMLAAAAQTGVWVCDGSTQIVPAGDEKQQESALRNHHRLVTRSLANGFYQGWDMHPGHLVTRWLATFGFYRESLVVAAPRLESYLQRQSGGVVDEPATAQALATVVLRGLDCGAFEEADVVALSSHSSTGILEELVQRTLPDIP
ncbi:DUF6986 family protein [Hoyosella altamirensis]|uniref:Citrate lyase beta subunit n=1 Tax=Hoyosella altamirensis TaxID=616997 RepID=A0A839RRA5_9ACTN|nr:aldolase/citrate lyase family protein [Hoyosella altamirensis]MBB3039502.1 citrate lyase beta subunit [Hoyosella altamirensis]